jgi:hypothetical protein
MGKSIEMEVFMGKSTFDYQRVTQREVIGA